MKFKLFLSFLSSLYLLSPILQVHSANTCTLSPTASSTVCAAGNGCPFSSNTIWTNCGGVAPTKADSASLENIGTYTVILDAGITVRTFTLGTTSPGTQELNVISSFNTTSRTVGETSSVRTYGYLSFAASAKTVYQLDNDLIVDGVLEILSGVFTGEADITVDSDGLFIWSGGTISGDSEILIQGPAVIDTPTATKLLDGKSLTSTSVMLIKSNITGVRNATIYVQGSTSVLQIDTGVSFPSPDGTFSILNEGIISGRFSVVGSFLNAGEISESNDAQGVLTDISINGILSLSDTSTVSIRLNGNAPGQGTQIRVSGATDLSGVLEITIGANFTATTETVIELITYGSVDGDFTSVVIDESAWDNTQCNTNTVKGSSKYTLTFNCNPPTNPGKSFPILIVAVAGGGGLLVIVIGVIVGVLIYKKVKAGKDQKKTMMQFEYFNYIK